LLRLLTVEKNQCQADLNPVNQESTITDGLRLHCKGLGSKCAVS